MMKSGMFTAAAALLITVQSAAAQPASPNPYKVGDYWIVDEYHVKPGGGLKLAKDIANDWQKREEFAKFKAGSKVLRSCRTRIREKASRTSC